MSERMTMNNEGKWTHVCPAEIVDRFKGTEFDKHKARAAAIEWLSGLRIRIGDVVWLPDANTGELLSFTKTAEGMSPSKPS